MTLREEQEKVHKAMTAALSGLQEDPWLAQRVLANVKGEEPVAKKISVSVILLIALLVLSMTAALAATLGMFGQLSLNHPADERLPALEEVSDSILASMSTEDDISIEIGQAYYEGNRVFISYRLAGNLVSVALHEGVPEENIQWNDELPEFIVAENWSNDIPELQRMNEWLNGEGQRWAVSSVASLHDGLFLQDGTYLDIIGGDQYVQPDGSIIGWKECEIPQEFVADSLMFKAVLFRSRTVSFQDYSTFKLYNERGENTDVFFTLNHNDRFICLKGDSATDQYRAQAELAAGSVDMKGVIRLTVPVEWVNDWNDWEGENHTDMIMGWNLYQNDRLISGAGTSSIHTEGMHTISFTQLYPHMDNIENLSLIPVYSQSGEHRDEAIRLKMITAPI